MEPTNDQISDSKTFEFHIQNIPKYNKYFGLHNKKCDVALIDSKDDCLSMKYLSRIIKNNEYHYYLLYEVSKRFCNCCGTMDCTSSYCRGTLEEVFYYKSKYLGTDFEIVRELYK
jgi:hypothetical protein